MKPIIGIFALTVVLQAQGFYRPDQIKKDAETELHKYFPRAVVMVSVEREAIIGFTCTMNLGDSTIEELTGVVDQIAAVQQLKQALLHGALREYSLFALGFDEQLIRLDLNRDRSEVVGIDQVEDYRNLVRSVLRVSATPCCWTGGWIHLGRCLRNQRGMVGWFQEKFRF